MGYNDKFDADEQITLEEQIAATILDDPEADILDEYAAELGRKILRLVVAQLRPDLLDPLAVIAATEDAQIEDAKTHPRNCTCFNCSP